MTDPSPFGGSAEGSNTPPEPPQSGGYPPPPPPPSGYPPPPPGGYQYTAAQYQSAYMDPAAPYGRHPSTGEPLSDKSKTVGGLLQLLGLIGILGVGRLYLGYIGLGVAQLIVGLLGGFVIGMFTCGIGFLIPVIWGIVDAVLILNDRVRDPLGHPLRG